MYLLKLEENNEISFTKDITYSTMPYAILLHTWGEDDKELNFENLKDGSGKTKDGYRKLMVYNISGWIVTVLINRIVLSFRRLLTLCSAGIVMRQGVIYISQMF